MAVKAAYSCTKRARFTSDELEPIQIALGRNYELVRGELYEVAPPSIRHGEIQVQTARKVADWSEGNDAGRVLTESGFRLETDPDTVRGPDVAFVAKGRINAEQARRGFPAVAPDFVVEIRSPGDTWANLQRKSREYFAAGTRLVVLIEPDQFIEMLRPGGERTRLGLDDFIEAPDVLPGFRCAVRDLFPKES